MTNLELIICEAENNGEINLDTRDMMLSILNESYNNSDYNARIKGYADKLHDLDLKINSINDKISKEQGAKDSHKKRSKAEAEAIIKQMNNLKHGANRLVPGNYKKLETLGDKLQETNNKGFSYEQEQEKKINNLKNSANKLSEEYNRIYGNTLFREDIRKCYKDKYGTTPPEHYKYNGVRESVLEEIYEAELCGEITPEERSTLIDYMDM